MMNGEFFVPDGSFLTRERKHCVIDPTDATIASLRLLALSVEHWVLIFQSIQIKQKTSVLLCVLHASVFIFFTMERRRAQRFTEKLS